MKEAWSAEASQRIIQWCEAMQASHEMLMAGLQREVGEGGDVQAAYRRWHEQVRREHDAHLDHMQQRYLDRQDKNDAT